jgi:Family of unknown function (DUF5947)
VSVLRTPRLAALTGRPAEPTAYHPECCDLCAETLPPGHRHLLDLANAELMCACGACAVLFDDQAAGGRHYRLVPRRRTELTGLRLDGQLWAALGIPVDMAFFTRSGAAEEVIAHYPSVAGALRAAVPSDSWQRLADLNPPLAGLDTDVEALVVNRTKGAADHWILPLDDCYRLTAVLREHWTGFSGGAQVWDRIRSFFGALREERQR